MEKVVRLEETPVVVKRMQKRTKFIIYSLLVTLCAVVLSSAIILVFKKMSTTFDHTKTECGYVQGNRLKVNTDGGVSRTVIEYLNIPYAVPPKGDLRWRAPVSLKENNSCWSDTLMFDNRTTMCVQYDSANKMIGDEDCLVLNIWKPLNAGRIPMPVVVWFHGGGLVTGHSRLPGFSPGAEFVASMEVVVVSVNYRLGVFGFLSLQELWTTNSSRTGKANGTNEAYGNYGIMDQILALRWVKNNIRRFRGDPNDVTIFGYSGGSTAVYSLLSATLGETKGLFHKAIASNGVSNFHTNRFEADSLSKPFIQKTKCENKSRNITANCLRHLDAKTVLASSPVSKPTNKMRDYEWQFPLNQNRTNLIPLQIIDQVIVQNPLNILVEKLKLLPNNEKPKLSILLGTMAQESAKIKAPKVTNWEELKEFVAPRAGAFNASYQELLNLYKNKTQLKYNSTAITPSLIYNLMTSDVIVTCSTTRLANDLLRYNGYSVYSYIVSQGLNPISGERVPAMDGVDVAALFGFRYEPFGTPSREDFKLKKNLRRVYKDFIFSKKGFESSYRNRTMDFFNSTVDVMDTYHSEECKMLHKYGFLKHSWGNLGVWD